jgi:DNA polymerase
MRVAELAHETDFDGWRVAARAFRVEGVEPGRARFVVAGAGQGGLFDAGPSTDSEASLPSPPATEATLVVPKAFVDLAKEVILHRTIDRFDLLYRLLWRLRDEPDLIKVVSDIDVADAFERAKNVSRSSHKMKAFVRFRQVKDDAGEVWVAWFEPAHRVLEKTAPFFMRRFTTMRWSILTPDGSAFWDGEALTMGPAATRDMAPGEDEIEEFWKTYYASTFNPARLKTRTMQGEMPKRYWKNLPEAALIPELIAGAQVRASTMVATPATEPNRRLDKTVAHFDRASLDAEAAPGSLEELAVGVQGCRRCPLWRDATQGVCGEGPKTASLMIVGEQPGDQEDLAGRPFVGPAGQVLDQALEEAGIDRSDVYVTNAVKHFKHEPRGKRRLHKTPNAGEVQACRWWLDHERKLIRPKLVLALGATASMAVLDRKVAVTKERGQALDLPDGGQAMITVHPSYLLRLPDEATKAAERARFVEDLRRVRHTLAAV